MQKQSLHACLEKALLHNAALSDELYDEVLADFVDQMKESRQKDDEDAIFCLVADTDQVAMMFVDVGNNVLSNDAARLRLKEIWQGNYSANIQKIIPTMSNELSKGNLAVAGLNYRYDRD